MAHWLLVNEMAQMDSQDRRTFDGILLGPNDIVLNGVIFIGEPQEIDLLRPPLTAEAMLEWFDISLKSSDILIFYSAAIATVMISTMIPTLLVMRLEPKKILL